MKNFSNTYTIIGAIIGDVIGSRFEHQNLKSTEFDLCHECCQFTDDSVLTIAVADAILNQKDFARTLWEIGQNYYDCGFGSRFKQWLDSKDLLPYNSYGNGSAMRALPVCFVSDDLNEVLNVAKQTAEVTHNHPEGIKGAQAVAAAGFLARKGKSKEEIKKYITETFNYDLNFTLDEIRPSYQFDVSCQGSVPQSIVSFLESTDFESAIRLAISIGGDSDTIASISGGLAAIYYQEIPQELVDYTLKKLPPEFRMVLENFDKKYKVNHKLYDIQSVLLGISVGDALGVPVEFKSRTYLKENPISEMLGFGTYDQLPGTWSDDSSMSFCLVESMISGLNLNDLARNFIKWYDESFWTARGEVFDIGIATQRAIDRLKQNVSPTQAGGREDFDNGNGSLMRILPIVFGLENLEWIQRFEIIHNVSSITHGHIRSILSCFYYVEFALLILQGKEKNSIYRQLQNSFPNYLEKLNIPVKEIECFDRLLKDDIASLSENDISSKGYVVASLEASIWCFLNTENFRQAVENAVNLGDDTDTVASITGGLAGLYYGKKEIPNTWLEPLARKDDIEELSFRLYKSLINRALG